MRKILFVIILMVSNFVLAYDLPNNITLNDKALSNAKEIDLVIPSFGSPYINYIEKDKERFGFEEIKMDCEDVSAIKQLDFNAAWIWNVNNFIKNPKDYLREIKKYNINTIFVQLPKNIQDLYQSLVFMDDNGIKVYATTGEPDAIFNNTGLLKELAEVKNFNLKNKVQFAGFQVDIEPYTLPDFNINESKYLNLYIETIKNINKEKGELEFSVVVPFWLSEKSIGDKNVLSQVLNNSDYIATMSYRTKMKDILNISNNTLCLASQSKKKVIIGLELTKLPNERHFIIGVNSFSKAVFSNKEGQYIANKDVLNSILSTTYNYEVKSSNVSFYSNPSQINEIFKNVPDFWSFKGWGLNGLSSDVVN